MLTTIGAVQTAAASRRASVAVAGVAALALVTFVIAQGTGAFFTDTTQADGDVTSGQVAITDDLGSSSTAFDIASVAPGYSEAFDITITDQTSNDLAPNELDLRLYAEDIGGDLGLLDALQVTIDADFADDALYQGSVGDLPTSYASASAWQYAAGSGTQATYTITVALPASAQSQNDLQDRDVSATWVWEARSTGQDA